MAAMEGKLTIDPVVKHRLCTGCGVCAAVCPRGAIEMVAHRRKGCHLPRLDRKRCTRCGLCHQVCPGHGVDFDSLNDELFGDTHEDAALGRYLGCYTGHPLGAGGGLVTSLLNFALEENLIDGALVTRAGGNNPLEPEAFIAKSSNEVLSPAGTMSGPVVTIDKALNEILHTDGRYAVVGLPCHIQALRKVERQIPGLSERIRYRISTLCGLNHRLCGGERPSRKLPVRCTLCGDLLGELSDLTCGDAPASEGTKPSQSQDFFIISRTTEAERLLEAAASKEAVHLSELEAQELPISRDHIAYMKRKLQARIDLLKWSGQNVPLHSQSRIPLVRADYIDALKSRMARPAGDRRIISGLFRLAGSLRRG